MYYYVSVFVVVLSCLARGGDAGRGGDVPSEDQVWLKQILNPEPFDYNTESDPFGDLPEEDVPHTLVCTGHSPGAHKTPASFPHTTLPASTASLVLTMDLIWYGSVPGRDVTFPLILCSAKACNTGRGDLVQVTVDEGMVSLLFRFGDQEVRGRVGVVQAMRTTRVFFAVLQNKVLWRQQNGATRQAVLQPPTHTRWYPYRAVFCGMPWSEAGFRGAITNVMINYKQVTFSKWEVQDTLKAPVTLGTYSRKHEYELSHAVVKCPLPYVSRLVLRVKDLKTSVHRPKDIALLYVPYETRLQRAEGSGWGVVISKKNVISFCYDILHRDGCQGYKVPLLEGDADLHEVQLTVVRGVLRLLTWTSPPTKQRSVSMRQFASPLPCSDNLYLGRVPDHLPHALTRQYTPFEGRIGHITFNKDLELNPKTFVERGAHRVSENLVMYALPAMSVRGDPAQYVEHPVHPGRTTHASCPPGVKGDWFDLTGRVLARGKEFIKIASPDNTMGEGVYTCASRHPMLGYRVHTVTAVLYTEHKGAVPGGGRLRNTESMLRFQLEFVLAWLVVVVTVCVVAALHAAVWCTRESCHNTGQRRATVLTLLARYNREYTWRRTPTHQQDLHGFVYQIHALHQDIAAQLTSRQRDVMDPLKRMQKTDRSSFDMEKLFSEGQWEAALEGEAEAPPSTSRDLPHSLPSHPLTYPHNYRYIAEQLMPKESKARREADTPTSPQHTTLSPHYNPP